MQKEWQEERLRLLSIEVQVQHMAYELNLLKSAGRRGQDQGQG